MIKASSVIRLDKEFSDSLRQAKENFSARTPLPIIINGLLGGAVTAYVSAAVRDLREAVRAPMLILASSDSERSSLAAALSADGISVLEYKPRDPVLYNVSASRDVDRERLSVLHSILRGEAEVVISTASSAVSYTMPPELLLESSLLIEVGRELRLSSFTERLVSLGFARVDMVEAAGQFSVRGGIVDLWHTASELPVRIELFGDEIDRMVSFDPETQRAVESKSFLLLLPAREVIISDSARGRISREIEKLIAAARTDAARERLIAEREVLASGRFPDFADKYFGLVYKEQASLLTYLSFSSRCATFVIGTNECREELRKRAGMLRDRRAELLSEGLVSESAAKYTGDEGELEAHLSSSVTLHLNPFAGGVGNLRASGLFGFRCRRTAAYGLNASLLFEDVISLRKGGYRTVIFSETRQGADSLIESLRASDIAASPIYDKDIDPSALMPGSVSVDVGACDGFDLMVPKIALLSMAKPEGRVAMQNRRRQRILRRAGGAGQRLMSYADLSVGDYVVHASYGIGLFEGIETVTLDGVTRDYIRIRYAGTDKLFVPCDKLEAIGKYIGARDDGGTVKLSKMGGGDWARSKSRAKSAAKDIAKDLIRLYAERQRLPGFAFPADSELEDEFAASFEYEETESQLVAIEEIKRDMMKPVPMNRLLCGDVGFGKTEVALRAAFKAIMGGKQVAILVPTTILALQHLETASSRMRGYPVTVEMVSRFRTPKEVERILLRTARGEIDILIGTHKLLSKKVSFRDLGLLIIDEEQRFGVAQKEKLKAMAGNVDVLTLSATPIPRTLNMAMNGISDMSILDEAPGERRPVQTYVLEYDEAVIYDAIERELMRSGQVLYLYNRVEEIEFVADKIMKRFPEARVAVAHGAMDRDELEDIWQALVREEIDVLVCTTIIETGVDLPGANTLIIENADRMGLSQLHQIRGRVGRSERQAYAYFTFRAGKALSDVATKRLNAIREFATFGAGFKVALRDLEIRGAGNLLGAEQHGYIESVGYDLYIKLLSEAVLDETGRSRETEPEATVDIKISANIPERYVRTSAERMEMYKKISLIREREDMLDVLDELIDRFGEPPRETVALLKISLIRALASASGIGKVAFSDGSVVFHAERLELGVWSELFGEIRGLTFRAASSPTVIYKLSSGEDKLEAAIKILDRYKAVLNEEKEARAASEKGKSET